MASVGQELKRERELRGITLKEIADTTKINLRYLRALEEDRLNMLPEKFFTRGIIRAYAKYLGLEEESVINTYLESLQPQEAEEEEESQHAEETPEPLPRRLKSSFIIMLVFFVALALVIVLYFVFQEKQDSPPPEISSPPPPAKKKPVLTPPLVKEEPEQTEKNTTMDLLISFKQDTWIEIYADGELQYTGIKPSGTQLQFQAKDEFLIHIGNAAGIIYTLNGTPGKKLGTTGEVVKDILINQENIQDFFAEDEALQTNGTDTS